LQIVGTTYGAGNGSTTFNLPDLQDNIAVGKSGTKALASTGGANTATSTGNVGGSTANATLSTAQLASHTHSLTTYNQPQTDPSTVTGFNKQATRSTSAGSASTNSSGSGSGHSHNMSATFSGDATSVLQPYLTLIYIGNIVENLNTIYKTPAIFENYKCCCI